MTTRPKKEPMMVQMKVGANGALFPLTSYDEERMMRFRRGAVVEVIEPRIYETDEFRDLKRFYNMAISRLAAALGTHRDTINFRLKIATGYVSEVAIWGDDIRLVPKSAADMEEPEFRDFFLRAEQHVGAHEGMCPGETFASIVKMDAMDLGIAARDVR